MSNYLSEILERKKQEVFFLKTQSMQMPSVSYARPKLKVALKDERLSVIAEIKRRSPSKGELSLIKDPLMLAREYAKGAPQALSILTDKVGFGGSKEDLMTVARSFPYIPILRKDFIIDPIQLLESKQMGASAVLLIVAALGNETSKFLELAREIGLDALVEVHDEEELKIALAAKADVIGVNCRSLKTFEIDLKIAEKIGRLIPSNIVKVAESGILTKEDARRMRLASFDAILVGEALVKSTDPKALIEELKI